MSKPKKPEVCEMVDHDGLFTTGDVKDVYEAHDLFLDWYFQENSTPQGRAVFGDWWGFALEKLDPENIRETIMRSCTGCRNYTLGEDPDCYDCLDDGHLDGRTKKKTFMVNF